MKARGDGLAFEPLHRAEFHFGEDTWAPEATVKLDGVALPGWKFFLEEMNDHWYEVLGGAAPEQYGNTPCGKQPKQEYWDRGLQRVASGPFLNKMGVIEWKGFCCSAIGLGGERGAGMYQNGRTP